MAEVNNYNYNLIKYSQLPTSKMMLSRLMSVTANARSQTTSNLKSSLRTLQSYNRVATVGST